MSVVFVFLVFLPVVAGELHAVCPNKEVEAFQGDDVWLQCHTVPQINLSQLTVDWQRPDLGHWVYVYRNQKDDPWPLMIQYRGRTKVDHGGLRRGNLTLFIPSVAPSDSGPYRSYIPGHRAGCTVQLTVVNRTREVSTTAPPSSTAPHRDVVTRPGRAGTAVIVTVCVLVAVGIVVVVVLLGKRRVIGTRRMRRQEETTPGDPDSEILNGVVTAGDDSNRSSVASQQLLGLSRAS